MLLHLIRSEARPQEIATCLRHNLQILQSRGTIPTMDIDETDLVSLGLQGLFSHRAGRNNGKSVEDVPLDGNHDSASSCATSPGCDEYNDDSTTLQPENSLEGKEDCYRLIKRSSTSESYEADDSLSPLVESPTVLSGGITNAQTFEDYAKIFPPTLGKPTRTQTVPSRLRSQVTSSSENSQQLHPNFSAPSQSVSYGHTSPLETPPQFNLPLSNPRTLLDKMCISFAEECRQLLRAGMPFDQLNNHGRIDCELLFRDRMPHDGWNISNWSCEVSISSSLLPMWMYNVTVVCFLDNECKLTIF